MSDLELSTIRNNRIEIPSQEDRIDYLVIQYYAHID